MARTGVEKKVEQALKALIAPRENSIRALAQALDTIAAAEAKAAGWKQRELVDAGLAAPRRLRAINAPGSAEPTSSS